MNKDKSSSDPVADALRDGLISPNVADSNFEDANVVDVLHNIASAGYAIAHAILPNAAPSHDAAGGTVGSLTEAMMGHTAALEHVASALADIAEAIRELAGKR